jgi:hypothetical protein
MLVTTLQKIADIINNAKENTKIFWLGKKEFVPRCVMKTAVRAMPDQHDKSLSG